MINAPAYVHGYYAVERIAARMPFLIEAGIEYPTPAFAIAKFVKAKLLAGYGQFR